MLAVDAAVVAGLLDAALAGQVAALAAAKVMLDGMIRLRNLMQLGPCDTATGAV